MISFTITLRKRQKAALQSSMKRAEQAGDLPKVKRILVVLLLSSGKAISEIVELLQVSRQAIYDWIKNYLWKGVKGLHSGKSPGRAPKLTKTQRRELGQLIKKGPEACGFPGSCEMPKLLLHGHQRLRTESPCYSVSSVGL